MNIFRTIAKLTSDCLTGIDGTSFDYARVGGCAGTVMLIGGAGVMIVQGKFEPVAFAGALGGLIAATCAGVKIKETTEPQTVTATQERTSGVATQTETRS